MQKTYKTAKPKVEEELEKPYVPIIPKQQPTLSGFYTWMKQRYGFIPDASTPGKYSDYYREYLVSL